MCSLSLEVPVSLLDSRWTLSVVFGSLEIHGPIHFPGSMGRPIRLVPVTRTLLYSRVSNHSYSRPVSPRQKPALWNRPDADSFMPGDARRDYLFRMRHLTGYLLLGLSFTGCQASANLREVEPSAPGGSGASSSDSITPTLRPVGERGFFALSGPFDAFDPNHSSVEIWTPSNVGDAPIVVYAHGGAGYREDDRARVEMFRRNGFATISFDSYEMNGFTDWEFVTRRITNGGKQDMIWGVYRGAVEYALAGGRWDARNVFLYGGSNGARVVLYAGTELDNANIRGIIAEAPAATGYELGDLEIPTIIPFGALDNWAGRSETDYVWTRTYPTSPISIDAWVRSLREKQRPVRFIFYEDAGHLLFEGPLKEVTVRRGEAIAFTAYEGAGPGVLGRYERDVISFVNDILGR